jgi:hypothetical protein
LPEERDPAASEQNPSPLKIFSDSQYDEDEHARKGDIQEGADNSETARNDSRLFLPCDGFRLYRKNS